MGNNIERQKALAWWHEHSKEDQEKFVFSWQDDNIHDFRANWHFEMVAASSSAIQAIYKWFNL